jgi:hypothetical protein
MSGFSIGAFCQADWPVVMDYVLGGGTLLISVETAGVPAFNFRIQNTGSRRQEIFRLPSYFPRKPVPGMYTIRAISSGAGIAQPVPLRLFGVGGGVRAVGSVAIDQVRFGPDTIRPRHKENATYVFHAHGF